MLPIAKCFKLPIASNYPMLQNASQLPNASQCYQLPNASNASNHPMLPITRCFQLPNACCRLGLELKGREEVISDNFLLIQGLRRRIAELEKHKFVLSYKVCWGD